MFTVILPFFFLLFSNKFRWIATEPVTVFIHCRARNIAEMCFIFINNSIVIGIFAFSHVIFQTCLNNVFYLFILYVASIKRSSAENCEDDKQQK